MAIPYTVFIHPKDKAALDALKSIPLLDEVVRQYLHYFHEQTLITYFQASALEITPRQLPKIHAMIVEMAGVLGIDTPRLFLMNDPWANAWTLGDRTPFVMIHSSLIEMLTDDELRCVIAHECGHIACRHMLYHSLAAFLLRGGTSMLPDMLKVVTVPLQMALLYWSRMSEFSADRAEACALGDVEPVKSSLLRLYTGPKSVTGEVDMDAYMDQAANFEQEMTSLWKQYLLLGAMTLTTHPMAAVRIREIHKWRDSREFQSVVKGEMSMAQASSDVRDLFS
jgi:Zn-dependent protease with chaperone function